MLLPCCPCNQQVVTGRVARNKMYKRKIPKQQTAAAQVQAARAASSSPCHADLRHNNQQLAGQQMKALRSLPLPYALHRLACN